MRMVVKNKVISITTMSSPPTMLIEQAYTSTQAQELFEYLETISELQKGQEEMPDIAGLVAKLKITMEEEVIRLVREELAKYREASLSK